MCDTYALHIHTYTYAYHWSGTSQGEPSDNDVDVRYEYSVLVDRGLEANSDLLNRWIYGAWTNCSQDCGEGLC